MVSLRHRRHRGVFMQESMIERRLKQRIESVGGKCWKWVSPGRSGVPDRIVIMPHGVIAFVETKSPGEKERKLQYIVHRYLTELGALVFPHVDSYLAVEDVVANLVLRSELAADREEAEKQNGI